MMRSLPLLLWLSVAWSAPSLQHACDEAEKAPTTVRVLTRQDEIIVGTLDIKELQVRTKYGSLRVPIEEIGRITFRPMLTRDEEREARAMIEELVEADGEVDENDTRAARRRLVELGSAVLEMLRDAQLEVEADSQETLTEVIQTILDETPERVLTSDVITTKRFTIHGDALIDGVGVRSAYGNLELSRAQIDRILLGNTSWRGETDRVLLIKTWADADGEYLNVRRCLESKTRLKMVEFTGSSATEFRRILKKHRLLVLPEFESGGSAPGQLAGQAASALGQFVRDGGVIISCGGTANMQFLSSGGLLACSGRANDGDATIRRRHPILRGLSGTIPKANATFPIFVQSGRKLTALATAPSGGVVVGVARIGEGAVVWCGWDFYEPKEPQQRVLSNAVRWGAGEFGDIESR